MTAPPEQLDPLLDQLALQTILVDPEDVMVLGSILEQIEKVEGLTRENGLSTAGAIAGGLKDLVEKLILQEAPDPTQPLELLNQGVKILQQQLRPGGAETSPPEQEAFWKRLEDLIGRRTVPPGSEKKAEVPSLPKGTNCLVAQDPELFRDFISEGLEHLDSIEVHLISLEQAPEDKETINAIFRPFHTLKGVSGFLNFRTSTAFPTQWNLCWTTPETINCVSIRTSSTLSWRPSIFSRK